MRKEPFAHYLMLCVQQIVANCNEFCKKYKKMKTESILVNNITYDLYIEYQTDEKKRFEFNDMTEKEWGFDFENFYQSGYWKNNCSIYSIFYKEEIVSHTTVTLFEVMVASEKKVWAQIGTVMTKERFRKQGLSRYLMQRIQQDFNEKIDGMFLFANDSVLDFYPKFGFIPVKEFQAGRKVNYKKSSFQAKQLDMDHENNRKLLETYIEKALPNSFFNLKNCDLIFFYCYAYPYFGFKETVFHIESLDTIAIAQIEENVLFLLNVFQLRNVQMNDIIQALSNPDITEVMYGFTPQDKEVIFTPYKEEDLTLFVSKELENFFKKNQLMIPLLAHT